VILAGCGSRGAVTFSIHEPSAAALDPLLDPRVSEFLVKAADGTLIGVASESQTQDPLPLGPLVSRTAPIDMTMSVMGGTDLIGMARIRDVQVEPGIQNTYTAEVRKPFVFVGSTLPPEFHQSPMNHLHPTEILDPSTSKDLAMPLTSGANAVKLPLGVSAAAVTSDGRFLFAGHGAQAGGQAGLTLIDTGSAASVGELPLGFTPARVVTAARDVAAAVLDATAPAGNVLLFTDVAGLTTNPGSASPTKIALRTDTPRNAAFSPDGQLLYVLTGGTTTDPCDTTPPPANAILLYGLDGTAQGAWQLPSFAADFAVDPQSGALVVSLSSANRVGTIAPGTPVGAVTPYSLIDKATCPTAVHVTNGDAFIATADEDPVDAPDTYRIVRVPTTGGQATPLLFPQPLYEQQINDSQPADGKVSFTLRLRPKFFEAYEIAVSPDASRVVFNTRTRYEEQNENFSLLADLSLNCSTTVEIVEYGRYVLDTRNGTANYEMRAQLVPSTAQEKTCTTCQDALVIIEFGCPSTVGDRPAGLTAVFGGP
jgi:hypothetical protein